MKTDQQLSNILSTHGPVECILSQNELEHIFLCHPKFGESVRRNGVRWYADDTVLQSHYDHLALPCRGKCNIPKAISMFAGTAPIQIHDMRTLDIGIVRFGITALVGECPVCNVVHAARKLP